MKRNATCPDSETRQPDTDRAEPFGANSKIIINAHRINEEFMPEFSNQVDSDFFSVKRSAPDQISQTLIEIVKKRIPSNFKFDPIATDHNRSSRHFRNGGQPDSPAP